MDRYLIAKQKQGLLKIAQPSTEDLARYGYDMSGAQIEAMEGRTEKIFLIVQKEIPNASVEEHIRRSAELMGEFQHLDS